MLILNTYFVVQKTTSQNEEFNQVCYTEKVGHFNLESFLHLCLHSWADKDAECPKEVYQINVFFRDISGIFYYWAYRSYGKASFLESQMIEEIFVYDF